MKIGVYIHGHKPSDGGRSSYAVRLMEYFNAAQSNHEFVYILRSDKLQYHESYKKFKNIVLYSALYGCYTMYSDGKKVETLHATSLLRAKFKIPSLNSINGEIRSRFQSSYFRKEKAFDSLIKFNGIDLVYYAMHCDCRHFDVPFYMTVWDIGHLDLPFFPEMHEKSEFTHRENYFNRHLKRATKIVVESEAGAQNLKDLYNVKLSKTILLPNFPGGVVDTHVDEKFKNEILQQYGLATKQFLFYPAQFWAHKNHTLIFKVLNELKQKHNIALKLVLSGADKGNLDYLKTYLAKFPAIQNQVVFAGFISTEAVRSLYEETLALIMPTFLGPTNMPVVEALGCNCPVICSDLAGHRTQNGDAALYFSPTSYLEATEKVKSIYENANLRNQLIEKGIVQYKAYLGFINHSFENILHSFDEFSAIRDNWSNH